MIEVSATVLNVSLLRELVAIRTLKYFVKVKCFAKITATVDLSHTTVLSNTESSYVYLEDWWWLLHPHKLFSILFPELIMIVLIFTCELFSLEKILQSFFYCVRLLQMNLQVVEGFFSASLIRYVHAFNHILLLTNEKSLKDMFLICASHLFLQAIVEVYLKL